MKLYGMALSAVPEKDNPNLYNILFAPICMEDKRREEAHVMQGLKIKRQVDVTDTPAVMQCFSDIVNAMGTVVTLQEDSLVGRPFVQVPLIMGQAMLQPVNIGLLIDQLFARKDYVVDAEIIELANTKSDDFFGKPLHELNREQVNHLVKECILPESRKAVQEVFAFSVRKKFLHEEPAMLAQHAEACGKFSKIIKKCNIKDGDYRGWDKDGKLLDDEYGGSLGEFIKKKMSQAVVPDYRSKHDDYLKQMHTRLHDEVDFTAVEELKAFAKNQGKLVGEACNKNPDLFRTLKPRGFGSSPEHYTEYPSYSYLEWGGDEKPYKKAFRQGFHEVYSGLYNIHYKTALDAVGEYFEDPVGDMISDSFDVAYGRRDGVDGICDFPLEREALWKMADQIHKLYGKEYQPSVACDVSSNPTLRRVQTVAP